MSERLEYGKPNNYSDKVLTGAWVFDRAAKAPKLPEERKFESTTTYSQAYVPKSFTAIDPALKWDQKLKCEDTNFISQLGCNDFPNFFQNFTSTYDLSYNHFPKCIKAELPRKRRCGHFEPLNEYLLSYGNITKFGDLDNKKDKWRCEAQDPRRTYTTHYNDTFIRPDCGDYTYKHAATPLVNSSKVNKTNVITEILKLRNKPQIDICPTTTLVQVPRPKSWNPITWEIIPEMPLRKCSEDDEKTDN